MGSSEEKGEKGTELFKHSHGVQSLLYPEKESVRGRRIVLVKQYSHIRKHKESVSVVFPAVFGGNKDRGHLETRINCATTPIHYQRGGHVSEGKIKKERERNSY